ncbi:unnamed protein product [Adineta steineri]|uniref:Uncharacterized protein n=1 Tax=Adineta steineri TaxID=433720 RepID=A0A814QCE8_9BILA|nr:unnamed protein product [Adineta steineri]CAF3522220.1 unnamed protein product [Adineta steineri]
MTALFIAIFGLISSVTIGANGYPLTCLDNCHFSQSFDSPFIIPDECNKTTSTFLCQVDVKIDYNQKKIQVTFGSERFYDRKRAIDDKYDHVQELTRINNTQISTKVFYSCTLEDRCEEKFLLNIQSKLIKHDYTKMQSKLMDLLTSKKSSPLTCKQYWSNKSVECNGTCTGERVQFLDPTTGRIVHTSDTPSCESQNISPNVQILAVKMPMSDRTRLSRKILFQCSKDYCNESEMTDQIEKIVNEDYRAFYQE